MKTETKNNGQFAVHEPQRLKKNQSRLKRKCFGCGDYFTCYRQANYDYCLNCAINNGRYLTKENPCSECGNGSGWIKFPNQPIRACKLCSLQPRVVQKEVKRG